MFLVWHLQADAQVYERYFCIFFQNQLVCPIITTTRTWLIKEQIMFLQLFQLLSVMVKDMVG